MPHAAFKSAIRWEDGGYFCSSSFQALIELQGLALGGLGVWSFALACWTVKREVVGRCVALLETGLRREARGLLPPSCAPLSTSCRHTPANAVTGPTNRDAPQGAHENLPELSSKRSSPRDTSTSNYSTPIQQCMSKVRTNKPITA